MDHRLAVVRRNFDGGVPPARGCPTNQQRQLETLALHLLCHMHHLVERWSNQAAEPNHVCLLRLCTFENFLAGNHYPHVDDLVVIASEDDSDNVLADVVNITLDRREHYLSLRFDYLASRLHCSLLSLHEGCQMCHRLLHDASGLDHLWQ